MKYFIFRWQCCESFKDSLLVRLLIKKIFAMFLHTQELRPCFPEKIFLFSFFSEILNLVIFILQPGLLQNGVKNVGLRSAAMHGQHSLVRSLGTPVSVRIGISAILVRFIGKPRMSP